MQAQRFRVSTLMSFVAVVALSLPTISAAQSQDVADANAPAVTQGKVRQGRVMTPSSSIAHEGDKGRRAHTHLQVFVPDEAVPLVGPPFAGLGFETTGMRLFSRAQEIALQS